VPPAAALPQGNDDTFVIQEHHARALHWDFRLERAGVLVSWAIPKGLPEDPKKNRLAVQTEDHPLEYAAFEDEIPAGEYGGGVVKIWDRGTYECEKWSDREVMVVLHGQQSHGRYVLFHTGGKDWMIHRMDPAPQDWEAMPELVRPMLASAGGLPSGRGEGDLSQEMAWAYEMKWDGVRAVMYVDGGRVRVMTRNDLEVVASYPELRELGAALGSTKIVLDGEIVALDESGHISFGALQRRMHVREAAKARRLAQQVPVTYIAFDVLYLDGRNLLATPYEQRREILQQLALRGPHWDTPPYFTGVGADVLAASVDQGLEGVVAKRLTSVYEPGRRSRDWVKIKNTRTQDVIIGGWRPGKGNRESTIGSLLLGVPAEDGLAYVGHVGTGFSQDVLVDLTGRLMALEQEGSPFAGVLPTDIRRDAHWVTPTLVGEVEFGEWTRDRRLRHPTWRGMRPDLTADDVARLTT